jgi:hypothetical protein
MCGRVFVRAFVLSLCLLASPVFAQSAAPPAPSAGRGSSGRREVVAGVAAFVVGYAYSATTALVYREKGGGVPVASFVPIVGPYVTLARGRVTPESTISGRIVVSSCTDCDYEALVGYVLLRIPEIVLGVLAPVAQLVGGILVVDGLDRTDAPAPRAPTPTLTVLPHVSPSAAGMAVRVSNW